MRLRAAMLWRRSSRFLRTRRATTRSRSTARTRSHPKHRWSSCTRTSPPRSASDDRRRRPDQPCRSTRPLEITKGINDWSEVGFYVFTSEQSGHGAQWVGDHIRPRVRVPDKWHWPVGVSLSTEIGYQRAVYSPDTLDVGDPAHRRQDIGALVLRRQSGVGTHLARAGRESGFGILRRRSR